MERIAPRWYEPHDGGARCLLCFRRCVVARGSFGFCGARGVSGDGDLVSPYLGRFAAIAVDPIEKKPLRRWRPGTEILSLGSVGCTADCGFCQNHEIARPTRDVRVVPVSIGDLVRAARDEGCPSVAFTYNEPTLQAEYIVSASRALRDAGLGVVLVTNGLFSEESRGELADAADAMNVDIKTFDAQAYRELGGSLDVVRDNVAFLLGRGVHVELTCLVVPGVSDDELGLSMMVDWIASLSRDLPLHITRYHPARRFTHPPTARELIERAHRMASSRLDHVYMGNVF